MSEPGKDPIKEMYEGMKEGAAIGQDVAKALSFLKGLFNAWVYLMAYPWLLILRYHHGERFLSLFYIMLSFNMMFIAASISDSSVGGLCCTLMLIACGYSYYCLLRRIKHKVDWYSYSHGASWFSKYIRKYSRKEVDLYLEPSIVMGIGLTLYCLTLEMGTRNTYYGSRNTLSFDGFGVYLFLSGVCLTIYQVKCYLAFRHQLLDRIDQRLIAENFDEAMAGETDPHETSGFIVQGAESWTEQERQVICSSLIEETSENSSNSLQKVE